jgi:tetratricopeptide (TPR) repeat protein
VVFFGMNLHAQEIDKDILDENILMANHGDIKSQLSLGRLFYRTNEHDKSIKWFKEAAMQGDSEGQKWLGHAYYLGPDKYKDYELAKKWYGKAAAQGDDEAQRYEKLISERRSESIGDAIEALEFLLVLFPVWWLLVGRFFNYQPKSIPVMLTIIFLGGVVGYVIAFACSGGAGGSSEMSASDWACLRPYLLIYYAILFFLTFRIKSTTNEENS